MREQPARGNAAGVSDPNSGRILEGRYRIGGRIARGGMASVYEATDLRLDRTIAIKIMHAGLGDGSANEHDFADRFVREARAAAKLSHPNIVAVYDQGTDETGAAPTVFLAMEYVPGHTLRDTIAKEAPMAPEKALALLEPVLAALSVAHRAGIVHRDVKPENVLIADDGRTKVADFGLAKAVSADTQHTVTQGVLIGTVSYLAPELVVEGIADARVDVYSVGVILFELLTGTKPHTGDSPIQVAYAHAHNDVPAPSSIVPGIPAYVDALVARATTRDRTLRPADAGVLLHHVRRVQAALHAGLTTDDELVDDLLPHARNAAAGERVDTTPEPLDQLRQVGAPRAAADDHRTQVIETPPAPPATARRLPPPAPVAQQQVGRRRRRRQPLVLLLIALLAAGIGGGAYWFGWARYTTTPGVLSDTRDQATAVLQRAELKVDFADSVYSDSVEAGHVVSTDPSPGSRILPHHTVVVTLSKGPEVHDLPDLKGLTVAEATSTLATIKMVVGRETDVFSETVPQGQIIRTDPAYGSTAAKNLPVDTAVRVWVSKGRKPITITDRTGDPAAPVVARWRKQHLKVVVNREFSDTVAEGAIISQNPRTGTLYRGDTITVTVSRGKPFVTVPSVWGMSTSSAVQRLEGLGLHVTTAHSAFYVGANRAVNTDPRAGQSVRVGSTIVVFIV
ncbi:MAG TPA: Stk1 family PASTA domain-containing Ser/Thr kinase [Nocardioides sp.]|nr:Stk1 family PASTA domain-containing Ser/Thr kinase [Nocardioides sp.]